MSRNDAMRLHADRAFEELDLARRASCEEAATAHLALSELHLRRMREIDQERAPALRIVY